MGLGKTAVVLQALTPAHLPALVLAPLRVAEEVWHVEAEKWRPDLPVQRVIGSPARRAAMLASPHPGLTVMTRDTVSDLRPGKHGFRTVVLDESSGYKTKSTGRWRDTRKIATGADHVWALTGTPTPNGYMDLYAQIFLLDRGKRLGATLTAYRDRYFTATKRHPITGHVIEWTLKPGASGSIDRKIEDLCLSMRASDYLTLPSFTVNEVKIALPLRARAIYDDLKKDLVADMGVLGTFTAANAATLSNRLRQVLAGFLYEDSTQNRAHLWLHDVRVKAVKEIIEGSGNVLLFYQFDAEKQALLKALKEFSPRLVSEPGVIAAWNRGEVRVLMAHPQSAGHGLNLQSGGHTAVWSSLPWSLEEWEQANKRLHRQGQQNAVIVHAPIVPGTVDRTVMTALKDKASVQDALMRYLSEDERILR